MKTSTASKYRAYITNLLPAFIMAMALCAAHNALAQTDAQFSQYYEATTFYNPASVGNTDSLRLRGASRLQWVGIDNAPQTFMATADMPVKIGKKRIGVGAFGEGESMGLYSSLNIGAQVAYKMRKFGGEISIGVTLGMYDQKFKGSDAYIPDNDDYHQGSDDAIPTRDLHGTVFDIGAGIWYKRKEIWAGLSATHLTSPTVTMRTEGTGENNPTYDYEFQAARTLYFMAGGNIQLKNTLFELMPSVLVKSDFTFTTVEATLRARYNRFLIFGVGYRWNNAVYATIGAEIKNFFVGYAYDYSTSAIMKASSGSHEVFLGYSMKLDLSDKNKNKHKSIRIM